MKKLTWITLLISFATAGLFAEVPGKSPWCFVEWMDPISGIITLSSSGKIIHGYVYGLFPEKVIIEEDINWYLDYLKKNGWYIYKVVGKHNDLPVFRLYVGGKDITSLLKQYMVVRLP